MTVAVTPADVRALVVEVLAELEAAKVEQSTPPVAHAPARASSPGSSPTPTATPRRVQQVSVRPDPDPNASANAPAGDAHPDIEVSDPTVPSERHRLGVDNPVNPAGLENLASSTSARLAVGRAGPRPRTRSVLLFGADHAVTQDAIFGDVPTALLNELGLFSVQTQVTSQDEYLVRPDLGRVLAAEARQMVDEKCVKQPQVQVVVGDGLSAAAITNNLPHIYPVISQGLTSAGIRLGTPFFIRYCRVGVMNDVNDIVKADMVVLLIGERPGLGVADAMSVYSGWRPTAGKTDAQRDVICMITQNGGTNPLEAGAFVVEHVKRVLTHQASGVELRLKGGEN